MNAHAINEGKFPDISNGKNTDFFYIEKEDPEEAVQEIVRLVKNNLPRYYKTPLESYSGADTDAERNCGSSEFESCTSGSFESTGRRFASGRISVSHWG